MRRLPLVVALGFAVVALTSRPARALTGETVVAHVPFAFHLGQQTFPAGDYRITQLNTVQPVLFIRTAVGAHPALVLTQPIDPERASARPQLVFDKVGKREFLRAVEVPGDTGAVLPTTRTELRAERELAEHQSATGSTHAPRS